MNIENFCTIVAAGLEVDPSTISPETHASDVRAWDSLGHLTLLMHLDRTFEGITKDVPELGSANSVREIYDILASRLPGQT